MSKTTAFAVACFLIATSCIASEPAKWVNPGWSAEEAVLAQALAIRAKKLGKITGIKFGNEWKPKVSLEWSLGRYGRTSVDAQYEPETQTILFTVRTMYELNVNYKTPLRLLDPKILAKDDSFGALADHELGHALSDVVSRRAGAGPYFTHEFFNSIPREKQLGLDIVAEGIGTFFGHVRYPTNENLSEVAFPATLEEQSSYTYEIVAFQGGYWLVKDILSKYGERGLAWLVTHPFIASDNNMREAAATYRSKALSELALR